MTSLHRDDFDSQPPGDESSHAHPQPFPSDSESARERELRELLQRLLRRAEHEPHSSGEDDDCVSQAILEELKLNAESPETVHDPIEAKRQRLVRGYEKHKKRAQRRRAREEAARSAAARPGARSTPARRLSDLKAQKPRINLSRFGEFLQRTKTTSELFRTLFDDAIRRAYDLLPAGQRSALGPLAAALAGEPAPHGDARDKATAKSLQRAVVDGLVPALRAACEDAASSFPANDPRCFAIRMLAKGLAATHLDDVRRGLTKGEVEAARAAAASGEDDPVAAAPTRGPSTSAIFEKVLLAIELVMNRQEALLEEAGRRSGERERLLRQRERERERKRVARQAKATAKPKSKPRSPKPKPKAK